MPTNGPVRDDSPAGLAAAWSDQDFRHAHPDVPEHLPYQPFYCEENIWQLCRHAQPGPGERLVAVVTGYGGRCALWHQRTAEVGGDAVLWDYHVMLFANGPDWQVWDLDTDLGLPVPAAAYLNATFPVGPRIPARFLPRFRLIVPDDYRAHLRSDRSHMRDEHGELTSPPPPWPPPGGGRDSNLARFISGDGTVVGEVMGLPGLKKKLGLTADG